MPTPRKAMLLTLALASNAMASGAEYRPHEVIVKYKEGALRYRQQVNALYDESGVADVHHFVGLMAGFEKLTLKENVKVEDAVAALRKSETVEYAQPNYILHTLPIQIASLPVTQSANSLCVLPGILNPSHCSAPELSSASYPFISDEAVSRPQLRRAPRLVSPPVSDRELSKVYGLEKVGAKSAWTISRGSRSFLVADIDTGIDYNHEDLSYNLWRNPNPTERKDIVGYDFVHNDGLPFDDNKHGTHTAGTIGAVGGNGIGISGVNQFVSIMALKFLSSDGGGTTADAIRAIDYAIDHGAKVLNNSWGGKADSDNPALREAVERAQAKDVLFIAAAGNDGTDNDGSDPNFPAAFDVDNIIAVAATDQNDNLAYFSNYGRTTTHLAAPGVDIYSTTPGNGYENLSGTSMACPHVAGAAAMLWSMHPGWNYRQVKDALLRAVDPVPNLEGKTVTGGRLNLLKALQSS